MKWNWRKHIKKNFYKILIHQAMEYSVIGTVWIVLEDDPIKWPLGLLIGTLVHVLVFTKIDFLHQLHHHHLGKNGHENHDDSGTTSN